MNSIYECHVNYLFVPFIVIFGLIGNTLGFILVMRNNKQKNGLILMYKYLFFANIVNLIIMIRHYLEFGFYWSLVNLNKYVCRLYWYYDFICGSIPSYLLVYYRGVLHPNY